MIRDYELVMIVSPEVSEEALGNTIEKVSQLISGRGGTVTEVNQWGRRKLAYPIKSFGEGTYVETRFKMEAGLTAELEAGLKLSEDVLRHLLVKLGE